MHACIHRNDKFHCIQITENFNMFSCMAVLKLSKVISFSIALRLLEDIILWTTYVTVTANFLRMTTTTFITLVLVEMSARFLDS